MLPIEDQKAALIAQGSIIRDKAVDLLSKVFTFRISLYEFFHREDLHLCEAALSTLYISDFLPYDTQTSEILALLATAREVIGPSKTVEPISFNTHLVFALHASQLATQRETLRTLIADISSRVNGHRAELNNLTALVISVLSALVAVISLWRGVHGGNISTESIKFVMGH